MGFIYLIIVLLATTIGAIAGVGGGVLIKPTLDALGHYNVEIIGVLSSAAVLAMAIVAMGRRLISGLKIDIKTILLATGAIAGGFAGKELFYLLAAEIDGSIIKVIQAILIALLMVIILFKSKFPRYCIENYLVVFIVGLVLGTLSSFLGIGGGPINVAVLYLFLNMDIKKAAVGSIFIILLAQASKLINIAISEDLSAYDLNMLWYMIPAGITGGFLGSFLHTKLKEKIIHILFDITVGIVILICGYNIITAVI